LPVESPQGWRIRKRTASRQSRWSRRTRPVSVEVWDCLTCLPLAMSWVDLRRVSRSIDGNVAALPPDFEKVALLSAPPLANLHCCWSHDSYQYTFTRDSLCLFVSTAHKKKTRLA
jgi:hypothetical protein